ncbi:MAG: thioredoxin family protein [Sphingomonadales bacterium]|nr:thioredoxin family protein [Sphingomonadales bacterium]
MGKGLCKAVGLLLLFLALTALRPVWAQYKVGDRARDFRLRNEGTGRTFVSLSSDPSAAGYVLVFMGLQCPWSKAYFDRLIRIDRRYRPLGYPVLLINPNDPNQIPADSPEEMQRAAREQAFPFPYLFDEVQDVTRDYGASRTPHVFILCKEKEGWMVRYSGAIDDNTEFPEKVTVHYLEDALESLMRGSFVRQESTPTVGCPIAWKKR